MPVYGDPIEPVFAPDEKLYLRVEPEHYPDAFSQPLLTFIPFPGFSVNRGRFSAPLDVLQPKHKDWGVVSFEVQHIPVRLEQEGQGKLSPIEYTFAPWHCPAPPEEWPPDGNYAHSEVRSARTGGGKHEPGKKVRMRFRELLRERLATERRPTGK